MNFRSAPRRVNGVGLVEVLAAVLVVSVGLLGIAKLQAVAIANTSIAAMRSIAAIQAASLASAMHANNSAFWAAGLAPATITVTGNTVSGLNQSASCINLVPPATGCTPAQMAAYDVQQWANSLQLVLPQDTATISCSTVVGVPVTCSIKLTWIEKNIALNNNASSTSADQSPTTYTLYVEP